MKKVQNLWFRCCFIFLGMNSVPCLAVTTMISGIVDNAVGTVVRIGLYNQPITIVPENYITRVQRNGRFATSFDLDKPVYGFIDFGGMNYAIFVQPGKHMVISLKHKALSFMGSSSAENRFLYQLKGDRGWNYEDFDLHLDPDANYLHMARKQARFLRMLTAKPNRFVPVFMQFFKAEDACRFHQFLLNFRLMYVSTHHLTGESEIYRFKIQK
jgi:hypothetical protein